MRGADRRIPSQEALRPIQTRIWPQRPTQDGGRHRRDRTRPMHDRSSIIDAMWICRIFSIREPLVRCSYGTERTSKNIQLITLGSLWSLRRPTNLSPAAPLFQYRGFSYRMITSLAPSILIVRGLSIPLTLWCIMDGYKATKPGNCLKGAAIHDIYIYLPALHGAPVA
jgi:hypothetical protein